MSGLARTAAAPFLGAAFRETLPCSDSSQRKGSAKTKASVASVSGPPAVTELSGVILAVTSLPRGYRLLVAHMPRHPNLPRGSARRFGTELPTYDAAGVCTKSVRAAAL